MEFLTELWMPIVASAVLVFIVSSILHMALPIHKSDHDKLADEDALMAFMREQGIRPGSYMFPCPSSMKDMGSPEMIEKYKQGPVAWMTVLPSGPPQMGKSLVHWFLYSLLIGVFIAYIAWQGLEPGAEYMTVFRMTSAVGFLGYGVPALVDSIWKGQRIGVSLKFVFDGFIYCLAAAGAFSWLWPAAA